MNNFNMEEEKMGLTLCEKIIKSHLVDGEYAPGNEVGIRIDQTLTQDATGTMAYLELEAMDIDKVKTELSVAYIDHNTLQTGFENADDHKFIQSVCKKRGVRYSRPGNGICHQVHLERFGIPGKTLIGSDSHTPTGGGLGYYIVLNQIDNRIKLNREVQNFALTNFKDNLLGMVHKDTNVTEAAGQQVSVYDYNKNSAAAFDMEVIAKKVAQILGFDVKKGTMIINPLRKPN